MMSRCGKGLLLLSVWALLFALSSCRSALYRAAAQGDVVVVRQEVAEGAKGEGETVWVNALWQYPAKLVLAPVDILLGICSFGVYNEAYLVSCVERFDESPAEVAWKNGHTDVLDVLAAAGAAVAPESMSGGVLLLQEDRYGGDGHTDDAMVLAEVGNENVADCFVRYWAAEDDWRQRKIARLAHFIWRRGGKGQVLWHFPGKVSTADMLETPDVLCYRRTGVQSAEVTMRFSDPSLVANKFELLFEASDRGVYRHLYADDKGVVRQGTGRFWIR